MAQATWEKIPSATQEKSKSTRESLKFVIGGLLMLGAVAYLLLSGTLAGAQYFITVDELASSSQYVGETVRVSGVVIGETIDYDLETLTIEFSIANIPSEFTDLAQTLYESANNPDALRLQVIVQNEPKPDLLQHEAQAILTGTLAEDGIFYADELLLKCPSRYEEAGPEV